MRLAFALPISGSNTSSSCFAFFFTHPPPFMTLLCFAWIWLRLIVKRCSAALSAAMPILPVCEQVDDRRDHSASQCFEAGTASTSAYSASCYVGTVNCLVNVQRHETCVSASNSWCCANWWLIRIDVGYFYFFIWLLGLCRWLRWKSETSFSQEGFFIES